MTRKNPSILLLLGNANIGGTEKQVVNFTRELLDRGLQVEVWTLAKSGPLFDFAKSMGVNLICIGLKSKNLISILVNCLKFSFRIFKTKPTFSFFFLPDCIIIGNVFLRLFSRRTIRVSCIRGRMREKNFILDFALKYCLEISNYFICNSKHLKRNLVFDYSLDESLIHVIHNGVNMNPFPLEVSKQPPRAVVLSNFYDYKGHLDLFEALIGINLDLKIVLCGEGPLEEELKSFVSMNYLSSMVEFRSPGFFVDELLSDFQFAIHPSQTEGFSNAILEEIASGLPTIAINVGGNSELVIDNFNGLLIPIGDVLQLRRSIVTLTIDPILRTRMSINSSNHAQNFSWANCVKSHLEFFRHIESVEN